VSLHSGIFSDYYYNFSTECAGEKILIIGQYLAKMWKKSMRLFGPPCMYPLTASKARWFLPSSSIDKKAVLPQGNRAMPQVFFSVEVRQQHSLQV